MGFFDKLFRRSAEKPLSPEELRKRLFDAAAAEETTTFAELCAAHEPTVLARFAEWAKVPEPYRTPEGLQWYGPGLIAVAQHFAERRGHPELLAGMMGSPEDNPLERWRRALVEVQPMMAELRFEEAAASLREVLDDSEGMQGPGVDQYLPVLQGRLGECLMQAGDIAGARAATEAALAGCERSGDDDGVVAYLGNLGEIHRYRGDGPAAAAAFERLGAIHARHGRTVQAELLLRQAALLRSGEPLCRVIAEVEGESFELSELSTPKGRVRFVFRRNRLTLRRATDAVEHGVAAAEREDFAEALTHFERAAQADAFDPWPRYHAGLTLLHLRRYAEAAASYRATEQLAPGWYHCRFDTWLADRLAAGALSHEAFLALHQLVDGALEPAAALALADEALAKGELAILHLLRGDALGRLTREAEAEAAYRSGLATADEPDVKTRLLVALANRTADALEKTRLLHEAVELGGNLVAAAMAKVLLASSAASGRS